MSSIFYIYRWIRLDKNTPFYVGKGCKDRAFRTKSQRSQYFRNIYSLTKCKVEIILSGLTEQQAYAKELEFISMYKSFGYCEANLTMGGIGCNAPTYETRKKMSLAKIGKYRGENSPHFGKGISEETKLKISKTLTGKKHSLETKKKMSEIKRKKVVDTVTGFVYQCVKHAAHILGLNYKTLQKRLSGFLKNDTGLAYVVSICA